MPEFSLIIPTYNRKEVLIKTLSQIKNTYPEAEIIIVDDASSDGTDKAISRLFGNSVIYLRNEKTQGKGFSLRKGFKEAKGQYLIFTDDDLPYGLKSIELILSELKKGEPVVIGERTYFNDNFVKKIGRLVFSAFIKPLLGIKIRDTQAGIKGFENTQGKKLFALSFINRFAIDLEIIFLCQHLHFPIKTAKVSVINEIPSNFSWKNFIEIAFDVLKIRLHKYPHEN